MNNDELERLYIFLGKIGLVIMLLPILVAFFRYKYLLLALRVFLWYLVFEVFFNVVEQVFIWLSIHHFEWIKPFVDLIKITDTSFFTITYQVNNFFFLGWFYYLILPKRVGIWIYRIAIALLLMVITNYLFIEGFRGFGVFNPNATSFFTFGVASFYLWYLYRDNLALPVNKNPYFWFSFGLIVPYLISAFFFMVIQDAFKEDFALFLVMSITKNFFLIIGQFLIALGFWYAPNARFLKAES